MGTDSQQEDEGESRSMFHPQGPTFFELVRAALSPIEKAYDRIAPKFDNSPFRTPDFILAAVALHIGELQSVGSALDICCGTGAGMQMLRPLCRDRVVGIDLSQGMLDVARQRLPDTDGEASLEFVQGDALDMPFEAEFDLAVSLGAFPHILEKDEPRFVAQVARALKPGGRFIFVTSNMPSVWSRRYWLFRGLNAAMRLRNLLIRPPFIAGKLTFLLPKAKRVLERHGFEVAVKEPFGGRLAYLKLVIARVNEHSVLKTEA